MREKRISKFKHLPKFVIVSVLMLLLTIGILPLGFRAEAATHSHEICKGSDCKETSHGKVTWTAYSNNFKYTNNVAYIYLTTGVSATLTVDSGNTLYLCLNGKILTGNIVVNGTLHLCDCQGTGIVNSGTNGGKSAVFGAKDSTIYYYGGTLQGGKSTSDDSVPLYTSSIIYLYAMPKFETQCAYDIRGLSAGFLRIRATLTKPTEPVRVNFGRNEDTVDMTKQTAVAITSDWYSKMGNANAEEYFKPRNSRAAKIELSGSNLVLRRYRVTFVDGNSESTDYAKYNGGTLASLPTPSRTGYTFKGWFTAQNGGTMITTSYPFSKDTTVYAQWTQSHQNHPICAGSSCSDGSHGNVEWATWNGEDDITYTNNVAYVYLTTDATNGRPITVNNGYTLYLCLNGKTLTGSAGYTIENNGTLVICDCSSRKTGKLVNTANGTAAPVRNSSTFTLYSGTLESTGGEDNRSRVPSGLYNYSVATICGGAITSTNGYGITADFSNVTTMTGGTVTGKQIAFYMGEAGTFTMTGGTLTSTSSHGIYTISKSAVIRIGGGTITAPEYGIYTYNSHPQIYLGGSPTIKGGSAEIFTDHSTSNIYANGWEGYDTPYSGGVLRLAYYTNYGDEDIACVYNVSDDNADKFTHASSHYRFVRKILDGKDCLIARYVNKHEVTFNPCGGEVDPEKQFVFKDSAYGTLPTPTRDGYRFDGWYTAKTSGTKIDSTTKVTATSDHTLYAHWVAEIISVEITWGAMEFTYCDGEWNPNTHTYENGYWAATADGDLVTVKNTGNVDVSVTFSYKQTNTAVSAAFVNDGDKSNITNPVALPVNETKKVRLTLTGKPSNPMTKEVLGTVKITLG